MSAPLPITPRLASARRTLPYLAVSLISLAIGCLWMAMVDLWPFGGHYLTHLDNGQGVAPSLGSLKLTWAGVEDAWWSFLSGGVMRNAMLAGFHLNVHPAAWLACMLPAESNLQALSWLLLIQLALCSASALFFLRKTFPKCQGAILMVLALSYTFSHFLFSKYTFLPFLNISALFPLFLYALDRLLKQGRFGWYLAISIYMVASAPYFFWMWGLFAVVYIASWYGVGFRKTVPLHLPLFVGITVATVAVSAFSWIPSFAATMESTRAGLKHPGWFEVTKSFDLFNLWMLSPLLIGGLATAGRGLKKLLLSPYAICMYLLIISCCILPMNWVWHSGPPVCFPVRFSYMITLMSCCLAGQVFSRLGDTSAPQLWKSGVAAVLTALILAGVCCATPAAERVLWVAAAVITAVTVPLRRFVVLSIATISVLGYVFTLNSPEYTLGMIGDPERVLRAEILGRELPGRQQNPWSRVKSFDFCLISNSSQSSGLNSFSNYAHTSTSEHQAAAESLGYPISYTGITDMGGTLFSDSFMGCEFIVCKHPILEQLLERIPSQASAYVYRNPYYWGDGVIIPADAINADKEWGDDPILNQQLLFEALGGEGQLFEKHAIVFDSQPDYSITGTYSTEGAEWLYTEGAPLHAFFSNDSWYKGYKAASQILEKKPHRPLFQLPVSDKKADFRLVLTDPTTLMEGQETVIVRNLERPMYKLDLQKLRTVAQKQQGKVRVVSIQGRTMEVEVHPDEENSVVVLPYFFHKGYSAEDDQGRELSVLPYHGFAAIPLTDRNTTKISLHYSLPLERQARLCSLVCLVISIGAAFVCKRLSRKSIGQAFLGWLHGALRIGAISVAWVIILSPVWAKAGQFLLK